MDEIKNILVTGGAGFMGSWLVDELIYRGQNVICVDDLSGGYLENINKKCKFYKMDLRDRKKIQQIIKEENIQIIYHLAAYAAEGQSVFSPIQINDINITPMNNLLVSAVNNDIKKFIFTSSMAVYGNQKPPFNENMPRRPNDPYGCGKAYCERMLEIFSDIYGFNYVILRPYNVYGPRQNIADPYRNVLGIWINMIMRGKPPFIYGDGEQTRAFSYIEDVTTAIANAVLFKKANNNIINIGSDEIISINDACDIVLDLLKSNLKPIHLEERPGEVKHAYCTIEKSVKLLDYKINYALKDGIKCMVEWAKCKGPQKPSYRLPLEITKNVPTVWKEKLI
jgi:UDP-glucose 4-epimerase